MQADGEPSPLDDVPELDEEESAAWEAYVELSASRPLGQAPRRLRPSDVEAWMRLNGVSGHEMRRLSGVIRRVDKAWYAKALAAHEAAEAEARRRLNVRGR